MKRLNLLLMFFAMYSPSISGKEIHEVQSFNQNWKFTLADSTLNASSTVFNDNSWRTLNLPHDWSIESDFSKDFPATPGGGALPGGIGWYRKTFTVDKTNKGKHVYIDFDGVYRNSEVWINGTSVGKRPYGYISFRYELTPYIKFGENNEIAVKVDNSKQPNSRWYSGSGIFRNVWLSILDQVHVDLWGTYVTTPNIKADSAEVAIQTTIRNDAKYLRTILVEQILYDADGKVVTKTRGSFYVNIGTSHQYLQKLIVKKPILWSIENPYLYKLVTKTYYFGSLTDEYVTPVGIRSFTFDVTKGFFLNGKHVKINGVCN